MLPMRRGAYITGNGSHDPLHGDLEFSERGHLVSPSSKSHASANSSTMPLNTRLLLGLLVFAGAVILILLSNASHEMHCVCQPCDSSNVKAGAVMQAAAVAAAAAVPTLAVQSTSVAVASSPALDIGQALPDSPLDSVSHSLAPPSAFFGVTCPVGDDPLCIYRHLSPMSYAPGKRRDAFVTMVSHRSYLAYAMVLLRSLRLARTRIPNLIVLELTSEPLNDAERAALMASGATEVRAIDPLPIHPHMDIPGSWTLAWHKLAVFGLVEFDRVLWMDADTVLRDNIDHLMEHDGEFASPATPSNCGGCGPPWDRELQDQGYWFVGAGLFVCRPSESRMREMLKVSESPSPDPVDQREYKGAWHWGDMEMLRVIFDQLHRGSWTRLGYAYDVTVGTSHCSYHATEHVRTLHYACYPPDMSKPWKQAPEGMATNTVATPQLKEAYALWNALYASANALASRAVRNQEIQRGG